MNGDKTLDASYKMLQKIRKEENILEMDDMHGIKDMSESAGGITAESGKRW